MVITKGHNIMFHGEIRKNNFEFSLVGTPFYLKLCPVNSEPIHFELSVSGTQSMECYNNPCDIVTQRVRHTRNYSLSQRQSVTVYLKRNNRVPLLCSYFPVCFQTGQE